MVPVQSGKELAWTQWTFRIFFLCVRGGEGGVRGTPGRGVWFLLKGKSQGPCEVGWGVKYLFSGPKLPPSGNLDRQATIRGEKIVYRRICTCNS